MDVVSRGDKTSLTLAARSPARWAQAAKYPEDVAAVCCLNVTAGHKAAKKLSKDRYFKCERPVVACVSRLLPVVGSLGRIIGGAPR